MAIADFSGSGEKLPNEVGKNSQRISLWLALIAVFGLILATLIAEGMMKEEREVRQRLGESRQLVVVTTPDWMAVDGELRRYERTKSGKETWRQVGLPIPVVVGRSGLAWAADQVREWGQSRTSSGPIKREGDGKSPAGLFSLGSAFGYEGKSDWPLLKLPYLHALPSVICVDDPGSRYYNRIVDRAAISPVDWQSAELMRREDDQYRLGVVVDHNYPATRPGDGSCIFLHIWEGRGKGTAGCTAMEASQMEEILNWLDASKKPLLVQLPASEYPKWLP